MFTASRILYGLGLRGLAPRWVSYCTKGGLPVAALGVCVCGYWVDIWFVTLTRSDLVLLPLVGFHGSQERILKGFHVRLLQVVMGVVGLLTKFRANSWFIGISTIGTFIGWWTINLTFLRFCKPCRRFPRSANGN